MRGWFVALFLLALPSMAHAASPEEVVQRQVDAYNVGDIEAFVATYTDEAVLSDFPGKPYLTGKAAMRAEYSRIFAAKIRPVVVISKRIVSGDYVVDEEVISRGGSEAARGVAIYHISNGFIDRVDFLPVVRTVKKHD